MYKRQILKTTLFLITVFLIGCSKTKTDDLQSYPITLNFTQNWDGTPVTASDFGTFNYTNQHGENLSITKLRYLLSRITLRRTNGETVELSNYNLIDMEDANSLTFTTSEDVLEGDFDNISFVYGFNEEDNQDGVYSDLNVANWNWPSMLGGGYHFMQFEGKFLDVNGDPQPFAYHNGTAKISEGNFEQNYVTFSFNQNFSINNATSIEIKMNIAEWFKNPNEWDLNVLNVTLMPNYQAQKMMQENAASVFSIGDIVTLLQE